MRLFDPSKGGYTWVTLPKARCRVHAASLFVRGSLMSVQPSATAVRAQTRICLLLSDAEQIREGVRRLSTVVYAEELVDMFGAGFHKQDIDEVGPGVPLRPMPSELAEQSTTMAAYEHSRIKSHTLWPNTYSDSHSMFQK